MTTDRNDDQEAPEVIAETEDDDAEGHVSLSAIARIRIAVNRQATGVYPPGASDEGHTETNVRKGH